MFDDSYNEQLLGNHWTFLNHETIYLWDVFKDVCL